MVASLHDSFPKLEKDQPTLIVDADEVLLQFVRRLEQFFPTKGFELRLESFRLQGNIYDKQSGIVANQDKVKSLIGSFFDECVDDIPAVPGAADALSQLSEHYQIIVLSNVPDNCRHRREQSLASLGMAYPVIANEGEKGPLVARILKSTTQPSVFIDDLPPHHTSVANHSPETQRIHFIGDERLSKMLPKAPDAHHRFKNWAEITENLTELLRG